MAEKQKQKYSLYFNNEQLASDLRALAAFYEVSYTEIVQQALTEYLKSRHDDLQKARAQAEERKAAKQKRKAQPQQERKAAKQEDQQEDQQAATPF